jgi:homoserine dehydrogenase
MHFPNLELSPEYSLHFSIFTLKIVNMATSIEMIDELKANLSHNLHHSFITLKPVDMAASKEMIDKLKATLSHGAIVVTPDSDNYDESFKRWSAAAEKKPVSLNLPHSSLSSES